MQQLSPDLVSLIGKSLSVVDKLACRQTAKMFLNIFAVTKLYDFDVHDLEPESNDNLGKQIMQRLDAIIKIMPRLRVLRLLVNEEVDEHVIYTTCMILCKHAYKYLQVYIYLDTRDFNIMWVQLCAMHRLHSRICHMQLCFYRAISTAFLDNIVDEFPSASFYVDCSISGLKSIGKSKMAERVTFASIYANEFSYLHISDRFTHSLCKFSVILDDPLIACNKPELITHINFTSLFWANYLSNIGTKEWIHAWFKKERLTNLIKIEVSFGLHTAPLFFAPLFNQIPDNIEVHIVNSINHYNFWMVLTLCNWLIQHSHVRVIFSAETYEEYICNLIVKRLLGKYAKVTINHTLSQTDLLYLEFAPLEYLLSQYQDQALHYQIGLIRTIYPMV